MTRISRLPDSGKLFTHDILDSALLPNAQSGLLSVYLDLAANIRSHAATHSVEDLLKRTQGEVYGLGTPAPQIANSGSALGAYHLFLGPV